MKKLILILIGIIFMVSMVNAETYIVDCNGGGDFTTIQAAIDHCFDYDEVVVWPGTYNENIDFMTKEISIYSSDGHDDTYIISDGTGTAVDMDNSNGSIWDFTIRSSNNGFGIGISCQVGYIHIYNNIIEYFDKGIYWNMTNGCISYNKIRYNKYCGINIIGGNVGDPVTQMYDNEIYDNHFGLKLYGALQLGAVDVNKCDIYNNDYGINLADTFNAFFRYCKIYDNNYAVNSTCSSIHLTHCTISGNENGIHESSANTTYIHNSILWGNNSSISGSGMNQVTYSCIEGGWAGEGNIDENPFFVDPANNDYSLQWNADNFSPCIDSGDPETEWDDDDTPPDMGAITAIEHSYFQDEYDGYEYNSIDWISYPVLNTITDGYKEALGLLHRQSLIDTITNSYPDAVLERVVYQGEDAIKFAGVWMNYFESGNFDSQQGYKVVLQAAYDDVPFIGISGQAMDVSEPIQLYANQDNWVGCYLEEPASITTAFSSIWNNLESVASEHWKFIISVEPSPLWTANPGELYIITVSRDYELVWGSSGGGVEPYRKEMTDYFDYEERLDYMAINVDTVYGDTTVTEIAVFDGEECLGASKVEDSYPVQILAYNPEGGSRAGGLQFQLYSGNRNATKSVTNYSVYENEISGYVNKPVYYDRDGYVNVKLNTEQAPEPEIEFTLLDNYPNPINTGLTHISFAPVKGDENSEIKIYNLRGQLVKKLNCENASFNSGLSTVSWDCTDTQGSTVSSGIYFYKLSSGEKTALKKMVIIR